jgi:uncharacterized protein (DUF433 family)
MVFPASPHIENLNGALRVAGSRVSLDSIVIAFRQGASPEQIVEWFPTLSMQQVQGALAYYLENRETVDCYISAGEREFERSVPPLSQANPKLYARLEEARHRLGMKH